MKRIMGAALAAVALATAACDDGLVDMPDLTVSTVEVGPSGRILLLDDTMRLTALPRTRDGTVLGSVVVGWAADDPEVLEVTSVGPNALVRALRPGVTGVRATADGKAGVAEVVVVASPPWAVALEVTPQATTLTTGRQVRLEATVRARDGTSIGGRSVTWRSSNGMVATVDSYGNSVYATLSAHSPGQAVITASAGGLETSVPVLVAEAPSPVLAVLVSPLSRAVWTSQLHSFTATVLGSGGTALAGHPVDWSVEDTTVASIDAHGVALGRKAGTTRVFARSGDVQGWATLRVVPLPGETMDFLLLPNADPQGKPRVTVTVGDTTWLDPHGVEHPAQLWLVGGALRMERLGGTLRYEQTLKLNRVVVDPATSGMSVVGTTNVVDRGEVLHLWPGGTMDYLLVSETTPGAEIPARFVEAGVLAVTQAVGDAPVLGYVYTLR